MRVRQVVVLGGDDIVKESLHTPPTPSPLSFFNTYKNERSVSRTQPLIQWKDGVVLCACARARALVCKCVIVNQQECWWTSHTRACIIDSCVHLSHVDHVT